MLLDAPRILLADDEETFRRSTARLFEQEGYCCDCAVDSDEANRLLTREHDVLVSDIRMPGYTGMDVLVGLRRALGSTPVILITAFGDEATHELARSMGAVAVLDKPFDVDALTAAVSNALAHSLS